MVLNTGKEYNLNVVKEIKVTNDFLGLDEQIRKCRNEEPFKDCKTKNYNEIILEQCGCLPFSIRSPEKVIFMLTIFDLRLNPLNFLGTLHE